MGNLFFFTDVDLIEDSGATGAQDAADAFGAQDASTFRLNSRHQSSGAAPHAYAVVRSYVLIREIPNDSAHVNLILKPIDQPAEAGGIGLPRIKFFIYRNVLRSSLIVGSNPGQFVPAGSIGMVDNIRTGYKASPAEPPLGNFLTSGSPQDPIEEDFLFMTLPEIKAGLSIGLFDPAGFGLEILFDDPGFNPDITFASRNCDAQSLYNVPSGSNTPADNFSIRAKKDYVLHFLDPCAFYGSLYFTGVRAKKSDGSDFEVNGKKRIEGDPLSVLLKKFYNHTRAYVDIRNENNHSFNYYAPVNDPARDFYSIYETDQLDLDFINDDGSNGAPGTGYYGTHGWPPLIVENSHFKPANKKEKNIVSVMLPKGNNNDALLYISAGIRNEGALDAPLKLSKKNGGPAFVELGPGTATHYGALELVIPNNKAANATSLIPTYSRVKYIRRVAEVKEKTAPADIEVQFLDNLFAPLALKDKLPGTASLKTSVYDAEQYVDLTNSDQLSGSEYVGNVGIALSNSNVVLFCCPVLERNEGGTRKSKQITVTTSKTDSVKEFIDRLGAERDKRPPVTTDKLSIGTEQPEVVYYQKRGGPFSRFVDDDFDGVVMLILDKGNFQNKVVAKANDASLFSPEFDVCLVAKAQTHRDANTLNDVDESPMPKPYFKCLLYLKGFRLESNGDVKVVEEDTGVQLYAKVTAPSKVHPILKDLDAVLDRTPTGLMPVDNVGFLIGEDGPARPTLLPYTHINDADFEKYFTDETDSFTGQKTTNRALADLLNNVYNEDLIEFITQLRSSAAGGDPTSKRLYDYIFSKFVKTPSATGPIVLNFVGGKISHGGPVHQGLMLEGSNYFAVWKAVENLKHIQHLFTNLVFGTQSSSNAAALEARLRPPYEFIVRSYPLVNNLVEALRAAGIRQPTDVLEAEKKNTITVGTIENDFTTMFRQDRTGAGLAERIENYYFKYLRGGGGRISYEQLLDALTRVSVNKQEYVSALSRTMYKGLDNTLSNYDFVNVAIGDGSNTAALFGGSDGIFLFNYSYGPDPYHIDVAATKSKNRVDNWLIDRTNDNPYAVHFGIYGMNGDPIDHRIIVERDGKGVTGNDPFTGEPTGAFTLLVSAGVSFTADKTHLEGVAKWDDGTKDLMIEKPKTNRFTSLSLTLDSDDDEEAFCIALYKTVSPEQVYFAKGFENLFEDDCFQLNNARTLTLWGPDEQESLAAIVEILKTNPTLKLEAMAGGGIGRLKSLANVEQYDETPIPEYATGNLVVHDGRLYKAIAPVPWGLFNPALWTLQPSVETDPDYAFQPPPDPLNDPVWHRVKQDKLTPPDLDTPEGVAEELADSKLRYSYASIAYDSLTNELKFRVESYASSLISQLYTQQAILVDNEPFLSGLSPNQQSLLPPTPTIFKQKNASDARVKDLNGAVVDDAYNPLLTSLRSCGLLHSILQRIKLEAFDNHPDFYHAIEAKLDAFAADPQVEVQLTPQGPPGSDVNETTLSLAAFKQIIAAQ